MKQQDWQTKKRIEQEYANSIMKLADFFFSKTMEHLSAEEQLERLRKASGNKVFQEHSRALAHKMITGLSASNARTWREAASEGMEGKRIYSLLAAEMQGATGAKVNELVQQNAELISSLPIDVAQRVNEIIQQQYLKGKRSDEISKLLIQHKVVRKLTAQRIALISRTETSKASTALTRIRSEDIGADWYIWRTSKDARVRAAHYIMDRVLVAWSEPPAPETLAGIRSKLGYYHAGDSPNCRCYPEPLLRLDQVAWPCKVYHSVNIAYMTRSKFEQMFILQKAA